MNNENDFKKIISLYDQSVRNFESDWQEINSELIKILKLKMVNKKEKILIN